MTQPAFAVSTTALPFKRPADEPSPDLLQTAWALLLVIGLFALVAVLWKRRYSVPGNHRPRPVVVSRTAVSPGLSLIVVEYADDRMLLAHTRDQVQVLKTERIVESVQ